MYDVSYSAQLDTGTNSTTYAANLASLLAVPASDIHIQLVVKLTLVAAGTIEAFDQASFKARLAASLSVEHEAFTVTVTAASVQVTTSMDAVDEYGATALISVLANHTSNTTMLSDLLGVEVESAAEKAWTIAAVRVLSPAHAAETARVLAPLSNATVASKSLGVTVLEALEPTVDIRLAEAPSPPPPAPPSPPLPPRPPLPFPSPPPGACVTEGPDMYIYAVTSASASPTPSLESLLPEALSLAASGLIVLASLAFAFAVTVSQMQQSVFGLCNGKRLRVRPAVGATEKAEPARRWTLNAMHVNQTGTAAERFYAINGARMLASVHIVLGHLYQMNALPGSTYIISWGFTWVPWFFMLSGFVLTHARLKSKDPHRHDLAIMFVWKRTATVYPLYAFGLGLALIINWWRDYTLPEWYELVAQGFFLQSWLPWLPERTVQVHCWFLSAMLPYWLLYDVFLHQIVFRINGMRHAGLVLLLLTLPPWLLYIFPSSLPGGDPQWYSMHKMGTLMSPTDFAVVILKFHPVCYVHVFIFGMVLARLRQLVAEQILTVAEEVRNVPHRTLVLMTMLERLFRFGASFGYIGLLLVFNMKELRPTSYKLSARLSVLMVLQGLVLVGLAPISNPAISNPSGVTKCSFAYYVTQRRLRDPVEWFFSHAPSTWGNLSYAQYVMQFVAYSLWPVKRLGVGEVLLFFTFLLAMSQVCCILVALPAGSWWIKARPSRIALVPCLVALLGAGLCAINRSSNKDGGGNAGCGHPITQAVLPPAYVHVADGARDVRLNWTANAADFAVARTLINPSILWSGGRLLRAARAHAITCAANRSFTYKGEAATELTTTWHSDIVLGGGEAVEGHADSEAWASWDVESWGLDGTAPLRLLETNHDAGSLLGTLCGDVTSWQPTNKTLLRMRVTGAEDPKLFKLPTSDSASSGATSPSFESVGIAFSHFTCQAMGETSRYGMFQIIEQVNVLSEAGIFSGQASPLPCGSTDGRDEKNWIAFRHEDRLRYVYSIAPHVVKTVSATSGECGVEPDLMTTKEGSEEVFEAMTALKSVEGMRLHGSGTAIRWSNDRYLNLFHTKDGTDRYVTMAYLMSASSPFAITNVSRPLPLQGGNASFASSLTLSPGGTKVIVGYGVADAESRALVMSKDYVASLFSWQDACTPPPPPPVGVRPSCDPEFDNPTLRGRDTCSLTNRTFVAGCVILLVLLCYICSRCFYSRRSRPQTTIAEQVCIHLPGVKVHLPSALQEEPSVADSTSGDTLGPSASNLVAVADPDELARVQEESIYVHLYV